MRTLVATLLLALAAGTAAAHEYQAGPIKIGHPWARPTVPGQAHGGAYLKLQNTGAAADRLVAASSPAAERVELHQMAMDGNVMRMREVTAIDVPPAQTVELKPGSWHLMLMGLKAPLKEGQRVPVTLRFAQGGEVQVELAIEQAPGGAKRAPAAAHEHKH